MKGLLITFLVLAATELAYGQQFDQQTGQQFEPRTQNDFSPRQKSQSESFAPQANQTRLAALQSTSSSDDESNKYVIMDEVDYGRESPTQRPTFGPENDPRIRSAIQERPRFSAQSSDRSAVSVLPSNRDSYQSNRRSVDSTQSNNRASNIRFASSQAQDRFSIYDLQITPAYENELKTKGYLYAPTTTQQASSNQIRLFADSRRADSNADEAKIFSSRVSTYQGNLVIDIDDQDLQRIENGSYTLDNFDRYDARGVVLRYVSRNNEKVNLTRINFGQAASNPNDSDTDRDRYVANDRVDRRDSDYRTSTADDRRRDGDGFGDWVLPSSRNNDRRDLTIDRVADRRDIRTTSDSRDSRNLRDSRYDASPIRDSYQDRMVDIYRDRTDRQLDRMTDRRDDRRYNEVSYNDRVSTSSADRDLVNDRERYLERELVELSDWQKDLAIKTQELEAKERELSRMNLRADPRGVRSETADLQASQYRPADFRAPYGTNASMVIDRYADSRLTTARAASPMLGNYGTASRLQDSNDPEFVRYAKQNQDQLTRINKKMAAIEQSNKLYALETQLDADHREQQLKQAKAKLNNGGHVTSFNDDGLVRNTLGGNMAAGRSRYPDNRLAANDVPPFQNGSGVSDLSLRPGRSFGDGGRGGDRESQQYGSNGSSDKLARALWFVTLMSIGFNFYLALLARSFYSRYNELAEELRETFSATV